MKNKPEVLFAAFEAVPFIKTGGLGDVAGSLPVALKGAGCEIRVMLPKLASIPRDFTAGMEHLGEFHVSLGWRNLTFGIKQLVHRGVTFCFLENDYYFGRENAYGYYDDGERMAFFSKAVVESIRHLKGFNCDVLHCNDWHTALAPVFLRELYRELPGYQNVRTVFTVHNVKFQGQFSDFVLGDILGLEKIRAADEQLRFDGNSVNYMKGALCYSDVLTTVSPTYSKELQNPLYGERLDDIFRRRENVLLGILNGIDTLEYDPSKDSLIPANFSADDPEGKAECKAALRKELGLSEDTGAPLVVMISRLTEQKGIDLLIRAIGEIIGSGMQVAVLGTGEKRYEEELRRCARQYPKSMSASIVFDVALSHRMYAGADMILMPSLFEPCGLSQMIAMRYGTLPVVRETGGLRDSVESYNENTGSGSGFSFSNYNSQEMLDTLHYASRVFADDRSAWRKIMLSAMKADFSWNRAAKRYMDIYREHL